MKLRGELLYFEEGDGALTVLDLIFEQLHRFPPAEAAALRALRAGDPEEAEVTLRGRLDEARLLECEEVDGIRLQVLWGKVKQRPARVPFTAPGGDLAAVWARAGELPAERVAPRWREPETWRRLAEDGRAGRFPLRLEGLLTLGAVRALRERMEGLTFSRNDIDPAAAEWVQPKEAIADLYRLCLAEPMRTLLQAVLGVELSDRLHFNCWRMTPGDYMKPHADGPLYQATVSFGLNEGWTAAHGGAIAFGTPGPGGFEVRERWLPHAGDALLFVPDAARSWHVVEPVEMGVRHTLTGWFVHADMPPQVGLTLSQLQDAS